MLLGDWFLAASTLLCFGAAAAYAAQQQWPVAMYWFGAFILDMGLVWLRLQQGTA